MQGHNYQVQLQYTPLREDCINYITNSLKNNFDVTGHQTQRDMVSVDITSNFPLAYGALKDMADLVIDQLSTLNINLLNAVIQKVNSSPIDLLAPIVGRRAYQLIKKFARIEHHTPLMYFYQNMIIDLQLSSRIERINMNPVAELN